jgi:colanic acid biosynthesis glycosyl transferase WcaI
MYSGDLGRAHAFDEILALARELRDRGTRLAFGVHGHRSRALKEAVTAEDTNIAFVDFAPQDRLQGRLAAADIHLVSLREEFCGTVVPSKFQGSIASGRPILFAGPPDSSVGRWIQEFGLGWIVTRSSVQDVAAQLLRWKSDAAAREAHNEHCFQIYRRHFSKSATLNQLDAALKDRLAHQRRPNGRNEAGH